MRTQLTNVNQTKGIHRYFPISDRDKKWGIYVITAGRTRIAAGEKYPPSGHPEGYDFAWENGRTLNEFTVVYLSRGSGWFESDFTPRKRVEAGQAFCMFPKVWHRYMPETKTGWDEHWIGFDGEFPRRIFRAGFFSPEEPILHPSREDVFLGLFTNLIEAMQLNTVALQQIMGGIASQILGSLYSGQQTQVAGDDEVQLVMQKAMEKMGAGFHSNFDVQALARELGVGYSRFRHIFSEHTGFAPHQYIQELRLARARTLLTETTLAVKDIAGKVGFEDEHYFSRVFKAKSQASPIQWRKRFQRKTSS